MNTISTEQLLSALRWRYATKAFDSSRTIPAATWSALEDALVLTPSSFGLQPSAPASAPTPGTSPR